MSKQEDPRQRIPCIARYPPAIFTFISDGPSIFLRKPRAPKHVIVESDDIREVACNLLNPRLARIRRQFDIGALQLFTSKHQNDFWEAPILERFIKELRSKEGCIARFHIDASVDDEIQLGGGDTPEVGEGYLVKWKLKRFREGDGIKRTLVRGKISWQ